jgi:biopolymer transport protein ExbB
MLAKLDFKHVTALRLALSLASAVALVTLFWSLPDRRSVSAQEEAAGPSAAPAPAAEPAATAPPVRPADKSINVFSLFLAGGIFMIPITAMSILAVTMAIERGLALRTQRVLPNELVAGLGQLAAGTGSFDPRKAYRICQQFPSAAANVVRVMLLKVGRPLPEVETAVAQASQREADRLYGNVRWLNLAASLSTLLGLLGTIQGMILAFHHLTTLDPNVDKLPVLASGIYTALVTTFAGLTVAVPSLLTAHFYETRILSLFRQIDELTFNLLPQLERYEGRVRFGRHAENGDGAVPPPLPEPARTEAPAN